MFMGIVESPGEIVVVTNTDGSHRLRIRTNLAFDDLHRGQSIAVSGIYLVVETFGDDWFEVFPTAETIEKTYLGDTVEGNRVNLERTLAADGHFDGHTVQGHVDRTTTVTNVERVGDGWFFEFDLLESLVNYVAQRDSVYLDGINLTVVDRRGGIFAAATIPTIYDLTTLSEKTVGGPIYAEADIVAKYVKSTLNGYAERLVVE